MKKILLLCVLFALGLCRVAAVRAADDPGDKFLEAYFLIQEGDTAERQSDGIKAAAKYNAALEILGEIKAQSPDWNPHIIEFRTRYIDEHLAALKPKVAPPAPAEPQPTPPAPVTPAPRMEAPQTPAEPVTPTAPATPAAPETPPSAVAPTTSAVPPVVEAPTAPAAPAAPTTPEAPTITTPPATSAVPAVVETPPAPAVPATPEAPAPTVESEQVKQLTAELQRAHDQVQQLEAARNDLNAKLQEQLNKVAPTQTNPQIEELLKTNQVLAAQLAAVQTEMAEARERAAAAATPPPAPVAPPPTVPAQPSEVERLRTELAQTRGELQRAKQDLQDTRVQLDTTKQALDKAQADNAELRHSYEQVIAQLTDANKKLSSAKASGDKDDEIIRQLRKENALLRIIAERKASASISPAETEEGAGGPSIPELRGWRPRARPQTVAKQQAKPEESKPQPQPPPSAMEESGRGKLVATLTSPKKTELPPPPPEQIVVTPAKTQTNAPAAIPVTAEKKPTPPPPPPPATVKTTAKTPEPAPKASETPAVAPAPTPRRAAAPDVRQLLNQGRAALALKAFDTADAKFTAVLEIDPTNTVALSSLGSVRYQQNRLDDAEQYLRKAVAAAPNDSTTRSLLGVVFFRKGLIEDSYSELNRAVAIDPHNAEAHNYLGIVLSQKGWSAAGEEEIRRAIEINPQYADAHFNLAVVYAKQRTPNVELARYHYKRALDLGAAPDPQLDALIKKLSDKSAAPDDAALYLEGELGNMFSGASTGGFLRRAPLLGNHGYLPTKTGLQTGFIAAGRGIRKGIVLDSIRLVDVAPTVAQLLGLEMKGTDGRALNEIIQ